MKTTSMDYENEWRGLFMRIDGAIVDAPAADVKVAQGYANWKDKGQFEKGIRLTVMADQRVYKVNEPIRIVHVVEVVDPAIVIDLMGPKPVYGEYYDGKLGTAALPEGQSPFEMPILNGRSKPGPGLDFNYDITTHAFDTAGKHQISWEVAGWRSNVLVVEVE